MTASLVPDPITRTRVLAHGGADLAAHRRTFGARPVLGEDVTGELERAGLTGRGGAGFPAWRKLDALRSAPGRDPVVVANGAEGEPLSAKDRSLLAARPHLVLDGLQLVAEAVGAARAVLYVGHDVEALRQAVRDRRATDRTRVEVVAAPDGFLSGEESAVVSAINGGTALPRDKRVPIRAAGVGGRPTLVQNVETLAHVALIARLGADWFRRAGTPAEPGTLLTTVSDARHEVVTEVEHGTRLRDLIRRTGHVIGGPVLVGGFHGAWITAGEAQDAVLSRAGLARFAASPGAGVLYLPGPDACGLVETARVATWLADRGALQCGPCRNGLPALAAAFTRLAFRDAGGRTVDDIKVLAGLVTGRGACHHPDGTARLVRSALRAFAADVEAHRRGFCLAGGAR